MKVKVRRLKPWVRKVLLFFTTPIVYRTIYIMVIAFLLAAVFWPKPAIEPAVQTTPEIKEVFAEVEIDKEEALIVEEEQAKDEKTTKVEKTEPTQPKTTTEQSSSNNSGTYKITHYGPDCRGCSGITASGYNVKNTIWYNDPQYGTIRVVATSKAIPLYSVIKIHNYNGGDLIAIVLDRGVSGNVIDLLVSSESEATQLGIRKNLTIEILRKGR